MGKSLSRRFSQLVAAGATYTRHTFNFGGDPAELVRFFAHG
jgi:hypothetical protein